MSAADSINPQFAGILKLMRIFQAENNIKDECFQNSLVAAAFARRRGYPNAYVKPVIAFYDRPYMEGEEERTTGVFVVHMVVGLDPAAPTEVVEPSDQYAWEDVQYFDNWKTLERVMKISQQKDKFAVPTDEEVGEGRNKAKVCLPPSDKALLKEFLEYKSTAVGMNELLTNFTGDVIIKATLSSMAESGRRDYLYRLWKFLVGYLENQEQLMNNIDEFARLCGKMPNPMNK